MMDSSPRNSGFRHGRRSCPICGTTKTIPIYKQTFESPSGASLLGRYLVVSCTACGFVYADHIPKQHSFDKYYRVLSRYEYAHVNGDSSISDLQNFGRLAGFVRRHCPDRSATILDIGCATGAFLAALKSRGFTHVEGLDPSPGCAMTARRLYGIPVITGTLFDLDKIKTLYDLIILTGVLEHIRDLRQAIAIITRRLKPGGRLFIGVPDAIRFQKAQSSPFQQISMEHINFFSLISLNNLMRTQCMKLVTSARWMRPQAIATTEPIIVAIYSDGGNEKMTVDKGSRLAVLQYLTQSRRIDQQTKSRIKRATANNQRILVWGTGTLTQRFLANGYLDRRCITAFVDSNPKVHGRTLAGKPILKPSDLLGHSEPILISSWMFQDEIFLQIKNNLHLPNKIILLYNIYNHLNFKS